MKWGVWAALVLWLIALPLVWFTTTLNTIEYVAPLSEKRALELLMVGIEGKQKPIPRDSIIAGTLKIARRPQTYSAVISVMYRLDGVVRRRSATLIYEPTARFGYTDREAIASDTE